MSEAIYTGNNHQAFQKRMDGHFSDLLRLLKNGKNLIRLLTISSSTLMLLCNIQTYSST